MGATRGGGGGGGGGGCLTCYFVDNQVASNLAALSLLLVQLAQESLPKCYINTEREGRVAPPSDTARYAWRMRGPSLSSGTPREPAGKRAAINTGMRQVEQ